MRYAQVIVDISADAVDRLFTYSVPDGMEIQAGQQVKIPFGPRKIEGFVLALSDRCELDSSKIKPIIEPVTDYAVILPELISLAEWIKKKYLCNLVDSLRLMIPSEMRGERVSEKTVRCARLVINKNEAEAFIGATRAKKQAECVRLLLDGPVKTREHKEFQSVFPVLKEKDIIEFFETDERRTPLALEGGKKSIDPTLMPAQQRAVDEMSAKIGTGGRFLLHGVTGSGKTEVYIRVIRNALNMGKTAIVLVPEIALTPQMVAWFHARFGQSAAVIHSRLSKGERYDEWRRIRTGKARVVIGARSAIFAPVENIGVIVLDEEHENSYKSDRRPRYDAREVAWQRCINNNAVLILGSATPSIETYMRTRPTVRPENRLELVSLSQRVNGRPLPEVSIVDMRAEIEQGNSSVFSYKLASEIEDCLSNGHQAMLFLNRRGYNSFVSCRACGKSIKCRNCDVTMTYHMDAKLLKCHYCGEVLMPPKTCPTCGSRHIKYFGTGTEKIEEEVKNRFGVPVTRVDVDTTQVKNAHERLLNEFAEGKTRIMVGTQMIAKGLDFPNVTLVGAISADMSLNLPDYRATERTFQLLTQVAGRAGRADIPGKVVIQTYEPEHYAVQLAAKQDYTAFYTREVAYRRMSLYPPFTLIARVVFSSENEKASEKACNDAEGELIEFIEENGIRRDVIHIHANTAPIKLLKGMFRHQLFIKMYAQGDTESVLEKMRDIAAAHDDAVRAELEINPVNMI